MIAHGDLRRETRYLIVRAHIALFPNLLMSDIFDDISVRLVTSLFQGRRCASIQRV